jgi:hypothetical protein
MATTHLTRRSPVRIARTARRTTRSPGTPKPPQFTRMKEGSFTIEAPKGYLSSAVLKLVGLEGKQRVYALALLVGRNEEDTVAVRYKCTGTDTIRCDIPVGSFTSIAALEHSLMEFLKGDGDLEGDPPTIKH